MSTQSAFGCCSVGSCMGPPIDGGNKDMATQTKTQRQAAAKKAAATRKRNAAKQGTSRTKGSARQTATSARRTASSAKRTAKQAARSGARRVDAETTGLGAVAQQVQR